MQKSPVEKTKNRIH